MQPATVKGADLMVKALENEGVERIFGLPGEENLDFLEALRSSPMQLVIVPVDYSENKRVLIDELARKLAEFR